VERLTEEQLNALKAWGDGLAQTGQEEMQAAGRAIQLLIQEVEALHIQIWHARFDHAAGADQVHGDEGERLPGRNLAGALLGRVRTMVHRPRSG
jgi:hypothetical protein